MHSLRCLPLRSFLLFSIIIDLLNAHVRFVCPRPVSPRSDIKKTTVSLGKTSCHANDGDQLDLLEVHPGLFTIRFEETMFMTGSPFRILLVNSRSSESDSNAEKRDLKARGKRGAVESTTQGTTNSLQNVLDFVNHTLNAINDVNDSLSNNSISGEGGTDSDERAVDKSNDSNNEANTTLISNVVIDTNTTNRNGGIQNSTATSVPDESMSESFSTQDSERASKTEQERSGGNRSTVDEENPTCILMDHVPHNDQAIVGDHCTKDGNNFPLGICEESTYYVTIRIPDVFCPDCFLIVQQVEARPDHEVCDVYANESNCNSYISCSRISIRPSLEGMDRDLRNCTNYLDNLPVDWAYRPLDIYQAGHVAAFTMDLLHEDLHIEINRGLHIGPLEKVEIRHNEEIIWTGKESESHKNADGILFVWHKVQEKYMDTLKQNKLVINIVGSKKSQALEIIFKSQIFSEGKMSLLHDTYSNHGWLIANRFLGPRAKDPMAALPVGPCVPEARHFLVFFEAVEAGYHGIMGMTLLENRAYITAVLHVELGRIQSIRFKGSELVGADDVVVKVHESFTGVFQVALDFTQQMKYIDTVQFLKTVEVKTNRQDAIMVGTLEEGFYSILRDQEGRVKGLGAFQPTQGYWMRAEIVLSGLSDPVPKIKTAQLLGSNVELMDLSKEIVNCTSRFCCLETYVHELSSEFLLHLLGGYARTEVTTQTESLSGQVVGSYDCSRYGGLCLMTSLLSKNNALTKTVGGTVNAVVLLDRAEVLEISILLNHPEWGWTIADNYTAVLTMRRSKEKIKLPLHFSWITEELYSAKERHPLAKDNTANRLFMFMDEEVHLDVSNRVHTLIAGRVHGLGRKECIQSKIHVVGKDRNFWSNVSSPFGTVYGVVMDYVKFIYDSNTTSIYIMDSKDSFTNCNFNKSKKVESTTSMGGLAIYFYRLKSSGFFYFADKDSCLSESPAKVVVQVVKGRESLVQDRSREDWCRTSFYSAWRQEQMWKWDPPSIGGPIVLGLFLGLTTGIGFILWQGVRMKQMPSGSASASRNSLSHFVRF